MGGCLDVRKCVVTLLIDQPGLKFSARVDLEESNKVLPVVILPELKFCKYNIFCAYVITIQKFTLILPNANYPIKFL